MSCAAPSDVSALSTFEKPQQTAVPYPIADWSHISFEGGQRWSCYIRANPKSRQFLLQDEKQWKAIILASVYLLRSVTTATVVVLYK